MSFKNKEMATPAQYAQFGLLVAQQAVEKMGQKENGFSKKEMQLLLTPPYNGKVKEIVDAVVAQVFEIKPNIWQRQMEKLSKFWKENFNHEILWNELILPEEVKEFTVLEYIPSCFTEDDIFNKYAELFGKDQIWSSYYDQSKKIGKSIIEQQSRPSGNRLILHRGGQGPDKEHLNKSYNDFCEDGKKYMVPIEGIITALRYVVETNKMMDYKSATKFHALSSRRSAMFMCRNFDGVFAVSSGGCSNRHLDSGPREIIF